MVERQKEYYWLTWSTGYDDTTPVAYAEEDIPLAHELTPQITGLKELPYSLELESVSISDKGLKRLGYLNFGCLPVDYQPNSLAWPMMSLKMKEIIDKLLIGNEGLKWIEAKVKGGEMGYPYFIPVFSKKLETLDYEKTSFVPNTDLIIKPVFDYNKICCYEIFHGHSSFWQITTQIYVSKTIKNELVKNLISGIKFEPAKVS
ncbi:MAG: hypothetical protein K0M40_13960 [Prolixibacteraceae bacterium]|nr:hypothetical protein [Prolixibacteraceae bacterium]